MSDGAPAAPVRAGTRWRDTLAAFCQGRVVAMLFLGFSAGLPLLLIFSTLSLWLREAEVSRSAVTFFSWAALGYSFKFVWAPLLDVLPLPGLSRWLGHRRAWLLVAQGAVIAAICWMALTDPRQGLTLMALAAVMLGFSSATQDVVIDAYRIEAAEPRLQAMMSASYIAGYRIGMLVAGAGSLKLAAHFGTTPEAYDYTAWRATYLCMALAMGVGVLTTLLVGEPRYGRRREVHLHGARDYARFLALFALVTGSFVLAYWQLSVPTGPLLGLGLPALVAAFVAEVGRFALAVALAALVARGLVAAGLVDRIALRESDVDTVADVLSRYGRAALLILALIALYRISDIVLGTIANVFYQDLGFSKDQIADITKTFGLLMTLAGGFVGGVLALRLGVLRVLLLGAVLAAATNLLFAWLAFQGASVPGLIVVVAADNLSAGIASAAFVAYLSALTNISFTAVQYALFSSLMTLLPKLLAGYSGTWVDGIGYVNFFIVTTLLGVPVLVLVWLAGRLTRVEQG
ncbi:MAG: MFS transporter [Candidatus Competibacterales bacterium]|nr:MFS transporter [Candidatus Competibacterales bacterium]